MHKTDKTRVFLATFAFATLLSGIASAAPALDAAGKCRDIRTRKFAQCGTAGTEPVATSAPAAGAATAPAAGTK